MELSETPGNPDMSDAPATLEAIANLKLPGVAVATPDEGAHLLMIRDDGIEHFPLRRAGKKSALRFAVGEPGRRGTIWRLWANRDTADVYLGSRNTADEVKVSLHQSGDWRLQIVRPDLPKTVRFGRVDGSSDGRVLDRWQRPDPNAIGWTHALTIVLPAHHLVPVPFDGVDWEDVRWLPAPNAGEHVAFEVYLVSPGHGIMTYGELVGSGGRLAVMDALELAGGEVAVVLALTVATDEVEAEAIATSESAAADMTPPETEFDRSPHLGPRQLVHGAHPDGSRRYYDLALVVRD